MNARILLVANAGAGKSTFAKHLETTQSFTRLSFATNVKRIGDGACDVMGIPPIKFKRRPMYQRVGKEGRAIDVLFWVRPLVEKHALAVHGGYINERGYVIDDGRFPNEAAYLREFCGFNIVKIDVPKEVCLERLRADAIASGATQEEVDRELTMAIFDDESERHIDEIVADVTIKNVTESDRDAGFRRLSTLIAYG